MAMTSFSAQSTPVEAESEMFITDPIFLVEYDPSTVHFGMLDSSVLISACKKALSYIHVSKPRQLTLYAKYVYDGASFYIVGNGKYKGIFVIRKSVCESGGAMLSMYQLYSKPPHPPGCPVISDTEVAGLFEDALIRYEKAFGGKDNFLKWLDKAAELMRNSCQGLQSSLCQTPYDSFQSFRKEILGNYRKSSQ